MTTKTNNGTTTTTTPDADGREGVVLKIADAGLPALPPNAKEELNACEETIDRTFRSWAEGARALARIRDLGLWRAMEGYASFDDYTRARWGFTRARASQLIGASEALKTLPKSIASTATADAALALGKIDPEDRKTVVEKAKALAAEKGSNSIGSRLIAKAARLTNASPTKRSRDSKEAKAKGRATKGAKGGYREGLGAAFDLRLCELDALGNEIAAIAEMPIGRDLLRASKAHWRTIEAAIGTIRETLAGCKPHAACPYGTECGSDCKACEGTGWVSKGVYDAIPKAIRDAASKKAETPASKKETKIPRAAKSKTEQAAKPKRKRTKKTATPKVTDGTDATT